MYKNKWIVDYDSDTIVRLVVAFVAFGPRAFHLSPVLAIPKFHWLAIGAKVSMQ